MNYKTPKTGSNKIFFNIILCLSLAFFTIYQGACYELRENDESSININQPLLTDKNLNNELSLLTELTTQDAEITEAHALIDRNPLLSNAYTQAFKDDSTEKMSKFLVFKYLACIIGGFGPFIPQLAISIKTGEYYGSSFLGYLIVATTVLTIEGITAWMLWELIDDTQKLVKAARLQQTNTTACNFQFIKGIGIGIFSLLLGALSSTPDVYKAYKYNAIKELAIISFIYDTIPRTIGFYKLFSSLNTANLKRACKDENFPEKQKAIEYVDLSKAYFLKACKENGVREVSESLQDCNDPSEIYSYLSLNRNQNIVQETLPHYYAKGIPRKIAQFLPIIFPLASAGFNTVLAYRGYNLFIENQGSLILLSAFSVLPTFLLGSYVIKEAAGALFDKIYLHNSKMPPSDYFGTFYPKTKLVFTGVSLILGSVTPISGFFVVIDTLKDSPLEPVKYGFATLGFVADLSFGSYTINSTLINFAEAIRSRCNKGTSYVFNCLRKQNELRDFIISSNGDSLKRFVDQFNHNSTLHALDPNDNISGNLDELKTS